MTTRKTQSGRKPSTNRTPTLRTRSLYEAYTRELIQIAGKQMERERSGHILEPEALVNETYLRLARRSGLCWEGRRQFLRVVDQEMKWTLIDFARRRDTRKCGGGMRHVVLDQANVSLGPEDPHSPALRNALRVLEKENPRVWRVVALRFFVGLTTVETAAAIGVSERTVKRDWSSARRWLVGELGPRRTASGRFDPRSRPALARGGPANQV